MIYIKNFIKKYYIIILGLILCALVIVNRVSSNHKTGIEEQFIDSITNTKVYKVSWNSDSEIIEIRNNYYANIFLDINNNCYTMDLVVDVTNDSNDDWNTIYFRDYPSAFVDKENGNISEIVNVENYTSKEKLEFDRKEDQTVFFIKLKQPLNIGKTISISMQYKAYIPNLDARYGYQILGNDSKDFYLANCIPILCPYENGDFKYSPYFEMGECFYSRMANYEVSITAPANYTVIATGNRKDVINNKNDTNTYNYIANGVRDYAVIIGNSYIEHIGKVDDITIGTYFHKGHEKEGKKALKTAIGAFKKFNSRLGKYPYSNFNVVELQMSMMGMEYPQIVLVTNKESGVGASVHEIIHQWFYQIVGNDCYNEAWIDESITTYLANPGLDEYTGIITKAYNEFENGDYGEKIYFCGASMYNKLEKKYGKKKINKFMKELLKNYAYQEIKTQQLVDLLIKYYGKDNKILRQYIDEKYF